MMAFEEANRCRYRAGAADGHYESWFQRANHPSRPIAFWLRQTLFCPQGSSAAPTGELWAIWFDGERGTIHAARQSHFLDASVPLAEQLQGRARSAGADLSWSLSVQGEASPLLLLPPALYERRLPAAKALVTLPGARFSGHFDVNGERFAIDDWQGSLNHNWGRRHTDEYAWGQVAGFPGAPDAFLECATARLRVGPFWTPQVSPLVLRLGGDEYRLNSIWQALQNHATRERLQWTLHTRADGISVRVQFSAPAAAFAGLRYDNPPGDIKTCLNSKLAACTLEVERRGHPALRLHAPHSAAFEILTDDPGHGVAMLA